MTNSVGTSKVKAVQEPGHANVWTIQDATGSTVARMTVNGDAESWAKRFEAALNAQCLPAAANEADRSANLPSSITVTKGADMESNKLPVRLVQAVIATDSVAMSAAPAIERDAAMTDLFVGLARVVQSGARVDLSEPLRIVVTKPIF